MIYWGHVDSQNNESRNQYDDDYSTNSEVGFLN